MLKILKNPVFTSSAVTIAFTALTHILNYVFTLSVIHFLTPIEYTDMALVMSLYGLMGIFAAALSIVTLSILSKNNHPELREQILATAKVTAIVLSFLSIFIVAPIIQYFFRLDSYQEVLISLLAGVGSLGTTLLTVHFQVAKEFVRAGWFSFLFTTLKLMLSLLLLWFGLKVMGVSLGLFGSTIFTFLLFFPTSARSELFKRSGIWPKAVTFYKHHRRIIITSLISSLTLMLCVNVDVLMSKRILGSEIAAGYLGISTLSKLFLYSSLAVMSVVFPYILSTTNIQSKKKMFNYFLAFIASAAVIFLLFAYYLDQFLVGLILGAKYLPYAQNFLPIAAAIVSMSFAYIFSYFASLIDAGHFKKTMLGSILVIGVLFVICRPYINQVLPLAAFLTLSFAILSISLYNFSIKNHFKESI
jgi:O-antigen/teichoic acid export membrane protein